MRYRQRAAVSLVLLVNLAGAPARAAEERADAVAAVRDLLVAGAITQACRPSFDFNRYKADALTALGRQAYGQLLAELERTRPGNVQNGADANLAMGRMMEGAVEKGRTLVADKGCEDPEVVAQLRSFDKAVP